MITFKDLESLKQFLIEDSKKTSINPIRFVNVDSMIMWIEVKKFILSLADETILLSKYCEGQDTTPNIKRINAAIKKVTKSQIIFPLSEYLRIVPEQAESIISKIIKGDYQNNDNGKLRIYFLMYRMKSLMRVIPSNDPRTSDCILLFETNEESDYKLTIIQKDLNVNLHGNEIEGFRKYLEYWEANPDKPLILHTNNAIHFEKNHFFDDVHVIVTSYDLLRYQYDLPSSISEENGTKENWDILVQHIITEGSFEGVCCQVLTINRYSSSLYEKWSSYNSFQKWLLWLWTRLQSDNRYEIMVAKSCKSSEEFLDAIYCGIFNYLNKPDFDNIYIDRRRILEYLKAVPTELFWNKISSLNKIDALSVLTSLTDIEKKTVFEIISDLNEKEKSTAIPILKNSYPQLYYYLQNDSISQIEGLSAEQIDYFSDYKWLKATDTLTDDFIARVKTIAIEKGASVFRMKPRNYYVTKHYNAHTLILFVDGMGIEYINYLYHLFSDLDDKLFSVTYEAGYCTLPSTTELNKDFMNGRNTVEPPIRELDELKHANNVHPESLIKQFDILDSIKNRVLGLLVGNINRIIIAADHGTSRLAVKIRNTTFDNVYPKPKNIEIYKYGRFCEGVQDEPMYPTAINYNDRLIFADYSRFIQNGSPIDEIHGGASWEEWIVPIITIERYSGSNSINSYVVKPKEKTYKPELGTKIVTVLFSISGPKRDSVSVKIKGNTYKCVETEGYYKFSFVPEKADTKVVVKVIADIIIGEFEIEIVQGINTNTKFNI